jgi:hypothetical protein
MFWWNSCGVLAVFNSNGILEAFWFVSGGVLVAIFLWYYVGLLIVLWSSSARVRVAFWVGRLTMCKKPPQTQSANQRNTTRRLPPEHHQKQTRMLPEYH